MYENQTLKGCWVNFLSETYFKSKEFKYIKKKFIAAYPQFREKWLYQKIYQAFREAQADGLMFVDASEYPYKYTSACERNGLRNELEKLSSSESVKKQLHQDYARLQDEAGKIHFEIEVLSKYMKLYPAINVKIANFISDRDIYLHTIQSEISILDKLINNV